MKKLSSILALMLLLHDFHNGRVDCVSSFYYSRYLTTSGIAAADCSKVGGRLAKLDNPTKLDYILSHQDLTNKKIWIGLKRQGGELKWSDGSPLTWAVWHQNEPNNRNGVENAVTLNARFADAFNNNWHYYLCEVIENSAAAIARKVWLSCWLALNLLIPVEHYSVDKVECPEDKIYFFPSHKANARNWTEADKLCKMANGTLTTLHTSDNKRMYERYKESYGLRVPSAWTATACFAIGLNGRGYSKPCSDLYYAICEGDVDTTPKGQSCYWTVPSNTWSNQSLACQAGGGELAAIRDLMDYKRAKPVFEPSTPIFIGASNLNADSVYRWMDGSLVTWPGYNPGPLKPYVGIKVGNTFNYYSETDENPALCERPVVAFPNANVIHSNSSVQVVCDKLCQFADGSTTKEWICNDQLPQEHEGCICPDQGWSMEYPWMSNLDITPIYDNDNTTCLSFPSTSPLLSLQNKAAFRRAFVLDIVLGESHHHAAIRVLAPEADSNSCSESSQLRECERGDGNIYQCFCRFDCQISIKLLLTSHVIASDETLQICEIAIVNN